MASPWMYCVYCERAFLSDQSQLCEYADCGSHQHKSCIPGILDWEDIRELNLYPEIPLLGAKYPLII
jgi:hypothetical protein